MRSATSPGSGRPSSGLPRRRAPAHLVTFGITPERAETGYGYIASGAELESVAGAFAVTGFVEKPDPETAQRYVASGEYFWNSGIFLFPASLYLSELERLRPDMLEACRAALAAAKAETDFVRLDKDAFAACPSDSIDYAVMEHTHAAAVVPVSMGWSDLGSWDALWEMADRDERGNALAGNVVAEATRNCYLRSEAGLVAAIGVEDIVVVATRDAVMVAPRNRTQEVRQLVARLLADKRDEADALPTVHRPWGSYRALHNGHRVQVKHILVRPAASCRCRCTTTAPSTGSCRGNGEDRVRRQGKNPDRGPVHLHPARHPAPSRKPGKNPAARHRGAIAAAISAKTTSSASRTITGANRAAAVAFHSHGSVVFSRPSILSYDGRQARSDIRRMRMTRISLGITAAILGGIALASASAQAQGLVTNQKLSAALANELVGNSVAECAKKNYAVTATVVDLDGVRQAVLRGDGAPIHTLDNAFYKAYSSASLTLSRKEDSTGAVAERMAKNAPTTVPQTPLPNVTYARGGVAIMAGGNIIGGLGVSGAPGGQFDEECARAALSKVADRMK